MPPPPRRATQAVKPPAEAAYWSVCRTRFETKGKSKHTRHDRCTWPEPGPDGVVIEVFPIAEFSTSLVLKTWGPGRYRIEYYDGSNTHMKSHGQLFEVQNPRNASLPTQRRGRRPAAEAASDEGDAGEFGGVSVRKDGAIGIFDVLTLLQQRDERAERRAEQMQERARVDAQAAKDHDRQFFALMLQMMQQGGGAKDTSSIARETQLAVREQFITLREELGLARAAQREEEPDDPDSDPGDRLLGAFVDELEEQIPGAIREGLPVILDMFKQRGFKPSAAVETAVAHMRGANGRANGS